MDGNYSLSDLAAVTGDNAFGGGNGAWWIIILFLFVFMGGNGFYGNRNNENCATTEDVQNQFNFAALERQNNETVAAVRQAAYDVTGNAKDLAYNQLGQIRDVEAMVAQNGYQASQCCCETNRNIDSVKYDMANYACQIQQTDTANTQKILDALTGNRMADMQNQINQLQLQAAMCGVPKITNYAYGITPLNWCGSCSGVNCGC
jgi:hypothetical protein